MGELAREALAFHQAEDALTAARAERRSLLLGTVLVALLGAQQLLVSGGLPVAEQVLAEGRPGVEWARVYWATLALLLGIYSLKKGLKHAGWRRARHLLSSCFNVLLAVYITSRWTDAFTTLLPVLLLPGVFGLILWYTMDIRQIRARVREARHGLLRAAGNSQENPVHHVQ